MEGESSAMVGLLYMLAGGASIAAACWWWWRVHEFMTTVEDRLSDIAARSAKSDNTR